MDETEKTDAMGQVIQIDEARIRDHLGEMVRGTVEEALNAMLDTKAGAVKLKMPRLRKQTFERPSSSGISEGKARSRRL